MEQSLYKNSKREFVANLNRKYNNRYNTNENYNKGTSSFDTTRTGCNTTLSSTNNVLSKQNSSNTKNCNYLYQMI